uniref:HMG box domain-containing protein n=1 Tax=viral metagenome TaxID=1070528 RepID=A0A6C0LXM7_9ZZZZ
MTTEAKIRAILKIVRDEVLSSLPSRSASDRKLVTNKEFGDRCVERVKEHFEKVKEASMKRPKRPPGAYILWSNDHRADAKQIVIDEMDGNVVNQQLVSQKTMEKLGEMWRNLSEEERAPYKERANVGRVKKATAKRKPSDMEDDDKLEYYALKLADALNKSTDEKTYFYNVTTDRFNQRNKKMEEKYIFDEDTHFCGVEDDVTAAIELMQ